MAWAGGHDLPVGIEGDVYVAVTWTADAEEDATVRLIVDVVERYPEGEGPPDEPFITGPADEPGVVDDQAADDGPATEDDRATGDEQAITEDGDPGGSGGADWIVIWLALGAVVTVAVGGWALVRRRTT